jgi:hypothetical protein
MKTPLNVLFMVIAYWIAIFSVMTVPKFIDNYTFNLIWLTMVIPNVLRVIVGNIPRLAVDRGFFFSATVVCLINTNMANKILTQTADSIKTYEGDKRKAFDLTMLLSATFAMGAIITYFAGIDKSIYSNMGWETVN